ncbi:MAG: translocation/assembly module TamB, partial [Bryobacterales bacterium]|nr:translocation/assembly module TamB [Bryobacterales bacterium]
ARDLLVQFAWQREGPRYVGKVAARPFHFNWPKIAPLDFDVDVDLAMEKEGLRFDRVVATRGKSEIQASGRMYDYRAPRFHMDVSGNFAMAEWVKETKLPLSPEGSAAAKAVFTYANGIYDLKGTVNGRRLAVRQGAWTVAPIDADTQFHLVPDLVTFTNLNARALGGTYRGSGDIRNWNRYHVTGTLNDASLEQLWNVERGRREMAWSASVTGPVEVQGTFTGAADTNVKAAVSLAPAGGKLPIGGLVRVEYDRGRNAISFENSFLKTPATRVDFRGRMGENIDVAMESSNINDALPAIALFADNPPSSLPLQLESGGLARFKGSVANLLTAPHVRGHADVTKAVVENRAVDHVTADVEAQAGQLSLTTMTVEQGAARLTGGLLLGLANWRATSSSPVTANLTIRQTPIERLLAENGTKSTDIKGLLSGTVQVKGTLENPAGNGQVTLTDALIAGEPFPRITGSVDYRPDLITVSDAVAEHRAGRIPFQARYAPNKDDFQSGKLTLEASTVNLALGAIEAVRKERPDLAARIRAKLAGTATLSKGTPLIDVLNAEMDIKAITVGKRVLGNLDLAARTQTGRIEVTAGGDFLGSSINGNGEWQMSGDAVGLGTLELGTLTLARLNDVLRAFGAERDIPLDGRFDSEIVFSGALRRPNTLSARVNLSQVLLYPKRGTAAAAPAVLDDLSLSNDGPIVAQFDAKGLQILQASLVGKDTNLAISGTLSLNARNAWNLSLQGGLNLGIFENYLPGLKTSGAAQVNALVRGTLQSPLLGGRMEIKNAAVTHRDLPNSIDRANGLVVFDRNRALLQELTAQTGGGELKLNGFVSFGGLEQATYRLNGQLDRVRIRYPEGASTTVNANLSLTGTSDQSLLAGVVTILRSGFSTRTDFGSVLFDKQPVQTPTSSPLLRGMQFDVRLVNAPSLQLETSLTQGVQTTVDLRLRGSPLKPVILGTVSVTQGELNFFGTTYTITRGTVSFFNAARIEPVLDLDLETQVRAVTVNMNISGSVDKPNITYRSDPPLQTSDIIALLAVGRTPVNSTIAPQANIGGSSNGLFAGTDTLLGQALSAGVSGRLQRFFGVSRVKIDPQLLGLETTPQARLTIEQQISRDITLTYVTNLTGTLQQLVRLQWDFKKNWSVTVIRDENGVVGSDIQFRTRLK